MSARNPDRKSVHTKESTCRDCWQVTCEAPAKIQKESGCRDAKHPAGGYTLHAGHVYSQEHDKERRYYVKLESICARCCRRMKKAARRPATPEEAAQYQAAKFSCCAQYQAAHPDAFRKEEAAQEEEAAK